MPYDAGCSENTGRTDLPSLCMGSAILFPGVPHSRVFFSANQPMFLHDPYTVESISTLAAGPRISLCMQTAVLD